MKELDRAKLMELFERAYDRAVNPSGFANMLRVLYYIREMAGLTVEETVDVYCQLDRELSSERYSRILGDDGGYWSEAWHWDFQRHRRILRLEGASKYGELLLSRKFSNFATRLHKLLRDRWKQGGRVPRFEFVSRR